MQDSIPFAVIGSTVQAEIKGRKVRARVYPWSPVEGICNANHIIWIVLVHFDLTEQQFIHVISFKHRCW